MYWVELSFALCSLPIFTTRSFKTVSFSAPSSPNLIFFWGLGLLASSFSTVNNQPAKLFFPRSFLKVFSAQRHEEHLKWWSCSKAFCGGSWFLRWSSVDLSRPTTVRKYLFLPIWQINTMISRKNYEFRRRARFSEVEVRKVKKSWNRDRNLFSHTYIDSNKNRFSAQRHEKIGTWIDDLTQKHFVVDPDFCGDHQWTCPGRQRYVNI